MSANGARLLVVDDEAGFRDLLTYELGSRGYRVTAVDGGEKATEAARRQTFDLCVCDVKMARMDGPAVLSALKALQPRLDVIMATGYATLETAIASLREGATDFLMKPVDLEALCRSLDRCVERRRLEDELGGERALRRELEAAYASLREAERVKDAFLSTVSHELRTPLSIVMGGLDCLNHGLPPEQFERLLGNVRRGASRLEEAIQALLDFQRLKRGDFKIAPLEVDLRALAGGILEEREESWRAKELAVSIELPEDFPPLWGDSRRLKELLQNLIVNAIQFGEKGGRVSIRGHFDDRFQTFTVSNTGAVIPEDARVHVFDAFYQAADYMTRRVGGFGLGLAVVKRIAEAHGGGVSISSWEDQGTSFHVSLPRKESVNARVEKLHARRR